MSLEEFTSHLEFFLGIRVAIIDCSTHSLTAGSEDSEGFVVL